MVHSDGSFVEAVHLSTGSFCSQVVRHGSGGSKVLGTLRHMIDSRTGQQSLQATCKIHQRCICWVSNCNHMDLMLNWLGIADENTKEQHQELSTELKKSVGMKVRSNKSWTFLHDIAISCSTTFESVSKVQLGLSCGWDGDGRGVAVVTTKD